MIIDLCQFGVIVMSNVFYILHNRLIINILSFNKLIGIKVVIGVYIKDLNMKKLFTLISLIVVISQALAKPNITKIFPKTTLAKLDSPKTSFRDTAKKTSALQHSNSSNLFASLDFFKAKRKATDTVKKMAVIKRTSIFDTVSTASVPFAWGDFTWMNGNDRRHSDILDTKYFTPRILVDVNYTISNQHPIDHTVVGSTALARDNEFQIALAALGGDFHYNNIRASILTQFGTRSTSVPRNDYSVLHGQFDLATAYRYFSEANAGYHFNIWHGINVDAGLFMSYVGLFSYYNQDNWSYQPSYTSDNTPWDFSGIRIQIFPSDKLKIEPWITNGWQTYGKFNNGFGLGGQINYRPYEWLNFVSNNYYGHDTQDAPHRARYHTDNSVEVRFYNNPKTFISRDAFSITSDFGWEKGPAENGVSAVNGFSSSMGAGNPAQYFVSGMIYHRLEILNNHIGWTIGGGFINNPGRYLVLPPTGAAGPIPTINSNILGGSTTTGTTGVGPYAFTYNPGDPFKGYDFSTTIDLMPNENLTFRLEWVHRHVNVPYFNGPGGVTSPDGYSNTPYGPGTASPNWKPDLVNSESRFIFAMLVRF